MNYTCVVFGILFIAAGFAFACGKGHIYCAMQKNMSEEERERIKIVPLCRNVGEVIALNGIIFLLKGLWPAFANHWFVAAMIAWLIIASFDIWYIEKSNRYRVK